MSMELETKVLIEKLVWERFECHIDVSVSRARQDGHLIARTRYKGVIISGRGVDLISCSDSFLRSYDALIMGANPHSSISKSRKSYYVHHCTKENLKQELQLLYKRRLRLDNIVIEAPVMEALEAWKERLALAVKIETKEKQLKEYDDSM